MIFIRSFTDMRPQFVFAHRLLNSGYTMEQLNEHMDKIALEEYEYYKSKSLKSKIAKIPKLVGKSTGRSLRWMLYG